MAIKKKVIKPDWFGGWDKIIKSIEVVNRASGRKLASKSEVTDNLLILLREYYVTTSNKVREAKDSDEGLKVFENMTKSFAVKVKKMFTRSVAKK